MLDKAREVFKGRKVIIATPFYMMWCSSPYTSSLAATLRLCFELGIDVTCMKVEGDSYVGRARNAFITYVYDETDATDLVFIDSDLEWNPEGFVRLLTHDVELIGGTYPQKNNWKQWAHRNYTDENGIPMGNPDTKTILCETIPAGFMRITRAAMDRMHSKYPNKRKVPGSAIKKELYDWFGELFEDVVFCNRFRNAGGEIWLDPNITFTHYGMHGTSGNFYDFMVRQPGGCKYRSKEQVPLVSIVIPCYNYGQYLNDAIYSAVNQTYRNIEVVIVNDGSTDNSEEIALQWANQKENVHYIYQDNQGVCKARNTGINASSGEWIICLDADDIISPTYVSKCLDKIDYYDIIGTGQREFGDTNNEYDLCEYPTFSLLCDGNAMNCASMFSREAYNAVGGWKEVLHSDNTGYEDWFMWIRMLKAGFKAYNIQEYLFLYRKHGKSRVDKSIENHDVLKAAILEQVR